MISPERLREGWGYLSETAPSTPCTERVSVLRRMRDMIDGLLPTPARLGRRVAVRVVHKPILRRPMVRGQVYTMGARAFDVRRVRVCKPRGRPRTALAVTLFDAASAPPPGPTV